MVSATKTFEKVNPRLKSLMGVQNGQNLIIFRFAKKFRINLKYVLIIKAGNCGRPPTNLKIYDVNGHEYV